MKVKENEFKKVLQLVVEYNSKDTLSNKVQKLKDIRTIGKKMELNKKFLANPRLTILERKYLDGILKKMEVNINTLNNPKTEKKRWM